MSRMFAMHPSETAFLKVKHLRWFIVLIVVATQYCCSGLVPAEQHDKQQNDSSQILIVMAGGIEIEPAAPGDTNTYKAKKLVAINDIKIHPARTADYTASGRSVVSVTPGDWSTVNGKGGFVMGDTIYMAAGWNPNVYDNNNTWEKSFHPIPNDFGTVSIWRPCCSI